MMKEFKETDVIFTYYRRFSWGRLKASLRKWKRKRQRGNMKRIDGR